jgi:hypothetical protein
MKRLSVFEHSFSSVLALFCSLIHSLFLSTFEKMEESPSFSLNLSRCLVVLESLELAEENLLEKVRNDPIKKKWILKKNCSARKAVLEAISGRNLPCFHNILIRQKIRSAGNFFLSVIRMVT